MINDGIADALVALVENQGVRTAGALAGLREDVFTTHPGGDSRPILEIGEHLLGLRKFVLSLMGSSSDAIDAGSIESVDDLRQRLAAAGRVLLEAIEAHDPDDWLCVPDEPREGPWGDEPTLRRVVWPLNDYANHLGDVRTIRFILGNGPEM